MNNSKNIHSEIDSELPFSKREFKSDSPSFKFSSSISLLDENGNLKDNLNTEETDKRAIFIQNYKYWNQETAFLSTNNLNNSYFETIVNMGIDAVPFILTELKKGPTPLVHALDRIFPGVMKYEDFVSLNVACEEWKKILLKSII